MSNYTPTLFLDMDGVLADFDKGVIQVLGATPEQYRTARGGNAFWRDLNLAAPNFYAHLPLMPHAQELVATLLRYTPIVLTGAHFKTDPDRLAVEDKRHWLRKYFPVLAPTMIGCKSEEKYLHMRQEGDILVDDRTKYAHLWTQAGGRFVLHTDALWEESVKRVNEIMEGGK